MKSKTLFVLLIFLQSLLVKGQDDLRSSLEEYLKIAETKNTEKTLDFMYPKFFEIFPREAMSKALNQSFNDPSLEIMLKNSKIISIEEPKQIDTLTFSKVKYSFEMSLKYIETPENPLPDDETLNITFNIFKNMYGDDKVKLDNSAKKFEIFTQKEMLMLKSKSVESWKVLGLEKNLMPILEKILPAKIIEKL